MAGTSDPPRPVLTDQEKDAAIQRHLDRYRVILSPAAYQSLRILARQQPTAPRLRRHPLGNHAASDAHDDHYSSENRADVKAALALYFDDGRSPNGPDRSTLLILQEDDVGGALADQLNARRDAAVGLELNDRLVSRLELGSALQMLWLRHRPLAILLDRRYRQFWSISQCCDAECYAERTYYNRLTDAIDELITTIYRTDFTEAKSSEMSEEK